MDSKGKKKSSKKGPVTAKEIEQALALEADLFGTSGKYEAPAIVTGEDADEEEEEMPLFFEDREGEQEEPASEGEDGPESREGGAGPSGRQPEPAAPTAAGAKRRAPVWEDDGEGEGAKQSVDVVSKKTLRKLRKGEDEKQLTAAEFEERLREQHRKLHPGAAKWAQLPNKKAKVRAEWEGEGSDSEGEEGAAGRLTRGFGTVLKKGARLLPPTYLETTRVRDANQHEPSNAVVQAVRFHPSRGEVLLTAGLDKKLRLFQVDGVRNPKLQSVHFSDMPLHDAQFVLGGDQILCTGRRKFFYLYDVTRGNVERVQGILGREERSFESFAVQPASTSDPVAAFLGNEGCIPLVSLKSRLPVATLKMAGAVRCAAFTGDGMGLYATGSDGVIHEFDLRMQRCLGRTADEGATRTTSLACSRDGNWVATGSDMGVVNIYRSDNLRVPAPSASGGVAVPRPSAPRAVPPEKAVMNLVTQVDSMAFSNDGQMLAIASRMKRDAMRIVHLPSCTVFQNWPTSRTPLGHVHCLDFSPRAGFVAIGNAQGKVLLYRLHHYASA